MENIPLLEEDKSNSADTKLSFSKICRTKGYRFEKHKVLTEDGYWLSVFRIPGKLNEPQTNPKPVVFMQHGVVDSADTFIMNDEERAPAFMLVNQGYDVWLGNTRGNKHSRDHQWLDPDDSEDKYQFFDFSFEEMGYFDIPAEIDYILAYTKKEKIAVLAHSQGATEILAKMADDIQWWNQRVAIFGCLGGVARLEHPSSQLVKDLANQPLVMDAIKTLGIVEMLYNNYYQSQIFATICGLVPFVCDFSIELVADANASQNNQERVGVFMAHYPSGSSLKSFEHFAQLIQSKKFQKFDYGEGNMEKYGSPTPPEIDLSKIKDTKIIQIVGTEDLLSPPKDNHWLRDQLGENVIYYKEYPLGHTSFLLAKDMLYMKDTIKVLQLNSWD